MHHIGRKAAARKPCDRKANAVHGDAVTQLCAFQNGLGGNGQNGGVRAFRDALQRADFLNDSGEQGRPPHLPTENLLQEKSA